MMKRAAIGFVFGLVLGLGASVGATFVGDLTTIWTTRLTATQVATQLATAIDTEILTLLGTSIDDSPVNGETAHSISSNWAYDHLNGVAGGQLVIGGTGSGDDLVFDATSHSTTGHVAARYAGVDMPLVANAYNLGNTTDTRKTAGDFAKTFTIPANSLRAGSTIRVRAAGRVTAAGGATNWSVTLNVGGVGHGSTPVIAPVLADQFRFDVVIGVDALGAAAACSRQSTMHTGPNTGMTTTGSEAPVTLDTTASIIVKATLAITAPDAVTEIRLSTLVVDYT